MGQLRNVHRHCHHNRLSFWLVFVSHGTLLACFVALADWPKVLLAVQKRPQCQGADGEFNEIQLLFLFAIPQFERLTITKCAM